MAGGAPLGDSALLRVLGDEDRAEFLSTARRRRFAKGEIVFHESDPGDSLYLVESGHVAVRVTTVNGDVATIHVLGPGEFFGELALVSPDTRRSATVSALDETTTLSIHRDRFEELRGRYAAMDHLLAEALATSTRRLTEHVLEALFVPTTTRVFKRLEALASVYGEGRDVAVIPLTQDDLASLAGSTRPTVNTILKKAEEDGIIALGRGRIEIRDAAELARRAQQD
jgi:CRP-like cAMP-binding protein